MHRIDGFGNVAGQFTGGDPLIPKPPTVVTPDWLNAVQEELANAVEGNGVVLAKATNTQLRTVLQTLFGRLGVANAWTALQAFSAGLTASAATITGALSASAATIAGTLTANAFRYPAPVARRFHVAASEFSAVEPTSAISLNTGSLSGPNWGSRSDSGQLLVGAARLPPGATITGIDVLAQNSGASASKDIIVQAYLETASLGAGNTGNGADVQTVLTNPNPTAVTYAAGKFGYMPVSLGGGPFILDAEGDSRLVFTLEFGTTAFSGDLKFYGLRIRYTQQELKA